MDESILDTIKKLLGISEDENSFDTDVLVHINSTILGLSQIGVSPKSGYISVDEDTEWSELIDDRKDFEPVKTYIYLKVRTVFDPPSSSSVQESIDRTISELEWRMMFQVERDMEEK